MTKKKKIVLATLAAFIGLIAIWFAYQVQTAELEKVGGGMYDKQTGKFYSPNEMERIKKERDANRRTTEDK